MLSGGYCYRKGFVFKVFSPIIVFCWNRNRFTNWKDTRSKGDNLYYNKSKFFFKQFAKEKKKRSKNDGTRKLINLTASHSWNNGWGGKNVGEENWEKRLVLKKKFNFVLSMLELIDEKSLIRSAVYYFLSRLSNSRKYIKGGGGDEE